MEGFLNQNLTEISAMEALENAAISLADIFVMQFDYENTIHLVDTKSIKTTKRQYGPQRNSKKK